MTTGVLVMAYGTPRGPEDVEAFYTDVRRGRPPSAEQLADLERRYRAIGGISPLNERTAGQISALGRALEEVEGGRYVLAYGAKHSRPRIEEAVEQLVGDGAKEIVGLVLAPHYSRLSVGEYIERARTRAEEIGIPAAFIEHWHTEDALVEVLARRVLAARSTLGGGGEELPDDEGIEVCFTAHSLPVRILAEGDPYPAQLEETAGLVAARAGLAHHRVGWQSAGRTPEPWIGPDVLELLRTLAAEGYRGVVVCPAGFASDHLEVLYDLDIEARGLAQELGLAFARTASLNDEPSVARALAARVAAARPSAPA
ncbi:MAG: ferrochelatase [Acidimicrobiaceae bacterium]|nr:ferrochelatase [Acidimicrobiaceae bacterium]